MNRSPSQFWSQAVHYLKMSLRGVWADVLNRISRQPVVGDGAVVVSLTTHGIRVRRVHRSIEAIGRGTLKPRRLILWLGLQEQEQGLPPALQRLQRRGLEVRYAPDVGPHTKYYPYVCSEAQHALPMVTADDDIWYPDYWLQRLVDAHAAQPQHVHCYRARRIVLDGEHLASYETWPFMDDDRPGSHVFATGVGGVIYPPALLDRLRDAGLAFQDSCPKADDLWLHVTALRNGVVAKQLAPRMQEFNTMPGTQSIGLQNQNVAMRRNDAQAAATYAHADLARIAGRSLAEA